MASLGDKIKSVFSAGEHSSEAEKGVVDHRTPGAYPSEESGTRSGVDQTHIGTKAVPSSGERDLGGTSQDPGFITGPSEHNKEPSEHSKLHNTGLGDSSNYEAGAATGNLHSNTQPGLGSREFDQSSKLTPTHHDSKLSSNSGNILNSSATPGTSSVATGASGLASRELGTEHSRQNVGSGVPDSTFGRTGIDQTHPSSNHPGTSSGLATGVGALAGHDSHNTVANGRDKSSIANDEKYWGDLPQGAGIYNTVTGHGSGENTTTQSRDVPRTGGVESSPRADTSSHRLSQGTGIYNTVTGHGSDREHEQAHTGSEHHRELPLGGTTGTASHNSPSTTRHGDSLTGDNSHRDRHIGEGAALGAGAAAYGAHEHQKHTGASGAQHGTALDSSVTQHSTTGLNPTSTDSSRGVNQEAGLLHRHNGQTDSSAKYGEKTSGLPYNSNEKTTDSGDHGHNIIGFLHHNNDKTKDHTSSEKVHHHNDESRNTTGATGFREPGATAAQTPHGLHSQGEHSNLGSGATRTLDDNNSSHTGRDIAGLGAAAGAGYGASRLAQHHNEPTVGKRDSSIPNAGSSSLNKPQSSVSQGPTGTSGSSAFSPTHAASQHLSTTAPDSIGSSRPNEDSTSHTGRNIAGAGVLGGAGYEASRLAQHHNEPSIGQRDSSILGNRGVLDQDPTRGNSSTTSRDAYNQVPSGTSQGNLRDTHGASQQSPHAVGGADSSQRSYNKLSDGTPSGVVTDASQNQPTATSNIGGSANASHSATSGAGQHETYNKLSSGTPSGVHIDDTPSSGTTGSHHSTHHHNPSAGTGAGNFSSNPVTSQSTATQSQAGTDHSNRGLGAAGAGAALGGVGAASKFTGSGPGSRVTHKCTNCGEENDISDKISEYFSRK